MLLFIRFAIFTHVNSKSLCSFGDLSSVDCRNKAETLFRDIGCSCDLLHLKGSRSPSNKVRSVNFTDGSTVYLCKKKKIYFSFISKAKTAGVLQG